jgi:hypothetical protein
VHSQYLSQHTDRRHKACHFQQTTSEHARRLCSVVEQDLAEILHDSWAQIGHDNDAIAIDHDGIAAQVINAADAQDVAALEASFKRVQTTYCNETLGEIADRILIYTVQKGWAGACKVRRCATALPCAALTIQSAIAHTCLQPLLRARRCRS